MKVMRMGVGEMNFLTLKTLEDLQVSMLRSRHTPNDDIGHELDTMTSPIGRHDVRNRSQHIMSIMLF